MIVKRLRFLGQVATHACDGKCHKAWGSNGGRPQVQLSDDVDDYAYLADGELGDAPAVTGITEGGQNKPVNARGPDDINKWCVRECERAWISPPGNPDAAPELPDFSARFYNKAPHKRTAATATPQPASPVTAVAASVSEEQARRLAGKLDPSQEQLLSEILRAASAKKDVP
ncbi:MAG TPA: hypothetical protein VLE97_06405 [Gaiellaceae bacterium]|nr:hypothetical protein [Gaiellaceae bacterium]